MGEGNGSEKQIAASAEQLGQMTDDELDAIEHCRLCLEPYQRCYCKEGRRRRAEEAGA